MWTTGAQRGPAILAVGRPSAGSFLLFGRHETDLPAERSQAQAEARIPLAHVDARRTHDSQAAPREGPQASVSLTRCSGGTAFHAHGTSMPCTGRAGLSRPAS